MSKFPCEKSGRVTAVVPPHTAEMVAEFIRPRNRERKCHHETTRKWECLEQPHQTGWPFSLWPVVSGWALSLLIFFFFFYCDAGFCCKRAFSNCGERGCSLLSGFSRWWLLLLHSTGSRASVVGFSSCSVWASLLLGMWKDSSRTRD